MSVALCSIGSRSSNRKPPALRSGQPGSSALGVSALTATIVIPTTVRAGDVLFIVVPLTTTTDTIATPTGWNKEAGPIDTTGSGTNGRAYLFSRIADGTEQGTTVTITKTGTTAGWRAQLAMFTASAGIDVVTTNVRAGAGDTAPILPSVTPTVQDSTLVGIVCCRQFTTGDALTQPAHFILGVNATFAPTVAVSRRAPVDATASGTATLSNTTASKWITFAIALKGLAPSSTVVRSYPGTNVYPNTTFYPGV